MDLLRGPGGPMRNTSWPKRSFCIIHRRCWATVWGRESETGQKKKAKKETFYADIPIGFVVTYTHRRLPTVFHRNKLWILGWLEFVSDLTNLHCVTCKGTGWPMHARWFLTDKSSHNHNSRVDFIFTLVLVFDEGTIKNKDIKKKHFSNSFGLTIWFY